VTRESPADEPAVPVLPDGLGFTCGSVLAISLHDLAEVPAI
jgi:hypothetical protein